MTPRQPSDIPSRTWIALLGHKDIPTDGVADYCAFLGRALAHHQIDLQITRVPVEKGWLPALLWICRTSSAWRGNWVLLHYTALGWSHRGFPFGAVAVILLLRAQKVNCAVVFHESNRQGERNVNWIRRVRGAYQEWVIRILHRFSLKSVFTIPLKMISWLPSYDTKSVFIPLGANVPEPLALTKKSPAEKGDGSTVVVFCVSDPPFRAKEIGEIAYAMQYAATSRPDLRIVFLGKGTREAHDAIARAFDAICVRVTNLGLCDLNEVSRVLAESDAMLCVRGKLNLRRASALAGIACAVPILGYSGAEEGTPLLDAGIEFVPEGDQEALGAALVRVLKDHVYWQQLRHKNICVQQQYFSWAVIAASYADAFAGIRL